MWRDEASCRDVDPEVFFPVAQEGSEAFARQVAVAVAVCVGCPVREACAAEAVRVDAVGVWGGLTEGERRRLRVGAVA